MEIRQCGTSIKRTPVTEMEKIHLGRQGIPIFLEKVKTCDCIQEIVLLMTCNRVEFYYACENPDQAKNWLLQTLSEMKLVPEATINDLLVERNEQKAIEHLFSVASGVESMVYGENEILTQVKDAYQRSLEYNLTGAILNKVFQSAVATGKRVRSETEISRGAYSVSSIAIEAIREKVLDYFSRKILIVGSGVMGNRALKKLEALGHPQIFMANRTQEKAEAATAELNAYVFDYDQLQEESKTFDIIILATSSKEYILKASQFMGDIQTMLVIDLGVPRNADPSLSEKFNIITVDGLKEIAEKNVHKRRGEREKVESIILEEMTNLAQWKKYRDAALNA